MRNLKKILALVLALVMSMSMLATANAFTDDESIDETFTEAVEVLSGLKVFQGRPDGSFDPKAGITRAEVAAIIYRIVSKDVEDKQVSIYADYNKFSDVNSASWYAGYVNFCANGLYIKGHDGKFAPNDPVTGYQALAMILRALGYDANGEFTGAGWEVRTATIAKSLGITDNIAAGTLGTAASREVVAEILFKAILADSVEYKPAFGYVSTETNLGYENFGLEKIEGVVTGNEYADLYADETMAEGKTRLGDRVLNISTEITDIGEARYAYVTGKTVLSGLTDTGSNVVFQTGADVSNIAKASEMKLGDAEKYLNFAGSDTYTSDYRIEYVIELSKSGLSDAEDAALKAALKANGGTFTDETTYYEYNKTIKAGAKITAMDYNYMHEIFIGSDEPGVVDNDEYYGEVYVGTKSNADKGEDISDKISWKNFKADYLEDNSKDADVAGNENGNWLKVTDVDGDGYADYIMKTEFELNAIEDITKKGKYVMAIGDDIDPDTVVTEDELAIGDIVLIARIDGVNYVDIAEIATEVIDKKGVNAKDETITCGDNVYGQSRIEPYVQPTGFEDDILDADTEVSYDLYLDHFGYVRVYTESAYNNGFVLLLDGYFKTDRRADDYKAQIWNTEADDDEDVVVVDAKAYPAAEFIDVTEGDDNGNRGTWDRLLEAQKTYANLSDNFVTNLAAFSVNEDNEYTLANIDTFRNVSNKKDFNVAEIVVNDDVAVSDRTLDNVNSETPIQATTATQYYFVVKGDGITKKVAEVYTWVGYKNAPDEAVLGDAAYAYAVTSEGKGNYDIAEVVVFETNAAVSNALNFVYAVDSKDIAKADDAFVIGYNAETEAYEADLTRDVDDADLNELVRFYKIFSDESVKEIVAGDYNKNHIFAGEAVLALDVTSRDYQKVYADGETFYFVPAETPCYIVNYKSTGNARTTYSIAEQEYRFEIGNELIFVTDAKDNVLYVINATQSVDVIADTEGTVAAVNTLYDEIFAENTPDEVLDIDDVIAAAKKATEDLLADPANTPAAEFEAGEAALTDINVLLGDDTLNDTEIDALTVAQEALKNAYNAALEVVELKSAKEAAKAALDEYAKFAAEKHGVTVDDIKDAVEDAKDYVDAQTEIEEIELYVVNDDETPNYGAGIMKIWMAAEDAKDAADALEGKVAIVYSAQGGTYTFDTLAAAVAAATAGDTIEMLDDDELTAQLTINADITLDGNGKTITAAGYKSTSDSSANGGILAYAGTIKNLKVVGPDTNIGWDSGEYGIKVYGAATLEDVTVSGANAGIQIAANTTLKGTIDVSDNEFGGIEVKSNATLTIDDEATLENTTESATNPTIWKDAEKDGTVVGGDLTSKLISGGKQYYFLNAANAQ